MKNVLSLILVCGLICSALLVITGCSNSDDGGSSRNAGKYQEVFDKINDCDVRSIGSSKKILQTDFYIRNWIKDNAALVSESNLVSGSDAGSELSKYVAKLDDDEKAEFGVKCQAVVDAELKLASTFDYNRAEAWGADVKEYSDANISSCNAFFEALGDALSAENIKPAAEYPYIEDPSEEEGAFDEATFLELISSMSNIETAVAGSSYQLNLDTADFMQFVIDNAKCSEDGVKAGVEKCYNMLSPSNKLTFDWNFSDVLSNIDELLAEPTTITDMGKSVAINDFSKDKLNKLVSVISNVSGVPYTN